MSPPLAVLRLGHRSGRDPRITTHLGLTARALGAHLFLLAGDRDPGVISGLMAVRDRFGGDFEAAQLRAGLGWLRRFVAGDAASGTPAGQAVHLTMYGVPWKEAVPRIRRDRPTVIVVGGAKVPGEVYQLCQHNVAIGNQPHSEVAALALFLERWGGQAEDAARFEGGRVEVVPSARFKTMKEHDPLPKPASAFGPDAALHAAFGIEHWLDHAEAEPAGVVVPTWQHLAGWDADSEE